MIKREGFCKLCETPIMSDCLPCSHMRPRRKHWWSPYWCGHCQWFEFRESVIANQSEGESDV